MGEEQGDVLMRVLASVRDGANLSGGIVHVWSAPAEGVFDPAEAGRFGREGGITETVEPTPKAVSRSKTRLPPHSTPRLGRFHA